MEILRANTPNARFSRHFQWTKSGIKLLQFSDRGTEEINPAKPHTENTINGNMTLAQYASEAIQHTRKQFDVIST